MRCWKWTVIVGILVTVLGVTSLPAGAQEQEKEIPDLGWKAGMWRLELSGWTGLHSGRRSRSGDFGFTGSATYEIPMKQHLTVGLRTYPFIVYDQDISGLDTVYALGFGPDMRVYSNGEEHRGFFLELNVGLIVQHGKFNGNSGTFNFLEEIGVGWKFKRDWHVGLKMRHMSNAGLADHNSGVNNVGLAVGYTFKPRKK